MGARLSQFLPKKTLEAMKANHSVVNPPLVGSMEGCMGANVQINISKPSVRGSFTGSTLRIPDPAYSTSQYLTYTGIDEIGNFGKAHYDLSDHPAYLTLMFANPILPGCHPGYFHVLSLGVYVELGKHMAVAFSGRNIHSVQAE